MHIILLLVVYGGKRVIIIVKICHQASIREVKGSYYYLTQRPFSLNIIFIFENTIDKTNFILSLVELDSKTLGIV